MKPMAQ